MKNTEFLNAVISGLNTRETRISEELTELRKELKGGFNGLREAAKTRTGKTNFEKNFGETPEIRK